jgi:hypothetical protein
MDFSRAQDCLPLTMSRMLEQIKAECGMVGTIILGGPEPRRGGEIVILRYGAYFFLL